MDATEALEEIRKLIDCGESGEEEMILLLLKIGDICDDVLGISA